MKYIYIISIILSSFFAISSLQAKDNSLQYAFFIPQDAFQYNTYAQPLQEVKKETTKVTTDLDSSKKTISKPTSDTTTSTASTTTAPQNKETQKTASKTTNKNTNKPLITLTPTINKETALAPFSIKFKQTTSNKIKTISPKEKSISDIFSEIPYPNNKLPKYKNAYLDYIMSLRVLHRTKKMQPDTKQEETLAKANTLRRFDI
jgi:hypothetical protein